MQRRHVDALVDRFVRLINRTVRQRIREEDIPVQLRQGGARFGLYHSWKIQRFDATHWIKTLEKKLPARLPPSYRSLVSRYVYPAFEVPPLVLLGNTGHTLYSEMSYVIFRERWLSDSMIGSGFVQFARPNSGDHDPVCFDFNRPDGEGEYPVVQLSYQQALVLKKPRILREIAPSFAVFLERYILRESLLSTKVGF